MGSVRGTSYPKHIRLFIRPLPQNARTHASTSRAPHRHLPRARRARPGTAHVHPGVRVERRLPRARPARWTPTASSSPGASRRPRQQTVRLRSTQALAERDGDDGDQRPRRRSARRTRSQTVARAAADRGGRRARAAGCATGDTGRSRPSWSPTPTATATATPPQDACTANAADHTSPCNGTATIGSPLTPRARPGRLLGPPAEVQALQAPRAGPADAVPHGRRADAVAPALAAGRGRHRAAGPASRRRGGDDASRSWPSPSRCTPPRPTITAVDAQLPVKAGDRLAARSVQADGGASDLGAIAARAGDDARHQAAAQDAGPDVDARHGLSPASYRAARPGRRRARRRPGRQGRRHAGQRRPRADRQRARRGRQPGAVEHVLHRAQRRARRRAGRRLGDQRRGRRARHGAGRDDLQGQRCPAVPAPPSPASSQSWPPAPRSACRPRSSPRRSTRRSAARSPRRRR